MATLQAVNSIPNFMSLAFSSAKVDGEPSFTVELTIESCSTCHAEGKNYGIDKMRPLT